MNVFSKHLWAVIVLVVAGSAAAAVHGLGGPVDVQPRLLADGRIAIDGATTITEPGSYIVTRNIVGTSQRPALTISASNVRVDLNGFALSNEGHHPVVKVEGVTTVVLENGAVVQRAFEHGVEFNEVRNFTIRRLIVTAPAGEGYGISLWHCESGLVEKTTVDGSFEGSLYIDVGRNIVVRDNIFRHTDCEAAVGINGDYVTFANNLLDSCSRLEIRGSGNRITNNEIHSGLYYSGIRVDGSRNRIDGNTLIDNGRWGLHFAPGSTENVFGGNVARGNGGTECQGASSGGDFCDEGTNNTSHGDNYMPGQM